MATVRISGNWRNPNKKEWAGAPTVDTEGRIERSVKIPEEIYQAIEAELARGSREGRIQLSGETYVDYFVD